MLVLGFNGVDSNTVAPVFQAECSKNNIRGVSVYMGSDVIDQWKLELQLRDAELLRESQLRDAELLLQDVKLQLAKALAENAVLRQNAGLPPPEEVGTDTDDGGDGSEK